MTSKIYEGLHSADPLVNKETIESPSEILPN